MSRHFTPKITRDEVPTTLLIYSIMFIHLVNFVTSMNSARTINVRLEVNRLDISLLLL